MPDVRTLARAYVSDRVKQLAAMGDKVGAIKAYRDESNVDLKIGTKPSPGGRLPGATIKAGGLPIILPPTGGANEIVPFNPKHVVMEVFGPPGTTATITYLDVNAQPQRVDDATLPWAYDTTTTQPAVFVNVQAQGDSDSIGCRIKIDDAVKDQRTANTLNAFVYCLDKSG